MQDQVERNPSRILIDNEMGRYVHTANLHLTFVKEKKFPKANIYNQQSAGFLMFQYFLWRRIYERKEERKKTSIKNMVNKKSDDTEHMIHEEDNSKMNKNRL